MNAAGWTISIIAIAVAGVLAIRWELESRREQQQQHEFMSAPWIAMLRQEITDALSTRDLDVEPFTLSEEFTDPPRHLRRDGDTIGFTVRVGHGVVEVADRPDPRADCRVISDYADALAIARDPDTGSADPAEVERRIADGRIRIEGDPSLMPTVLQQLDIHRLVATHTA